MTVYAKALVEKKNSTDTQILFSGVFESYIIDYLVFRNISSVYKVIYNLSFKQILDLVEASTWVAD